MQEISMSGICRMLRGKTYIKKTNNLQENRESNSRVSITSIGSISVLRYFKNGLRSVGVLRKTFFFFSTILV